MQQRGQRELPVRQALQQEPQRASLLQEPEQRERASVQPWVLRAFQRQQLRERLQPSEQQVLRRALPREPSELQRPEQELRQERQPVQPSEQQVRQQASRRRQALQLVRPEQLRELRPVLQPASWF